MVKFVTLLTLLTTAIPLSHSQGSTKAKLKEPVALTCIKPEGGTCKPSGTTCTLPDVHRSDLTCADATNVCCGPECYDGSNILFQYAGKTNVTKSGLQCQRWDSQVPHKHTAKANYFPEKTLSEANNYCRDVWGKWGIRPSCITTNPNVTMENCQFPVCKGIDVKKCYFREVPTYTGTVNKSKSGHTCLRWDSEEVQNKCPPCNKPSNFPDVTISAANNYCRQPTMLQWWLGYKPFCVTETGISYCDIDHCPDKCSKVLENTYIMAVPKYQINPGKKRFTKLDTQEECISLCKKTPGCYRWTYSTNTFFVPGMRKRCYMMSQARVMKTTETYKGIVSGSRFTC